MRLCKGSCQIYDREKKQFKDVEFEGVFHEWGIDFEEFEGGPGNYTVGIVELPDGTIITPIPTCIKFLDKEEGKDERR